MTISIAGRRRPAAWLASCLFLAMVASPAFAGRTVSMHRMQSREHGAAQGVTLGQMRGVALSVAERNGWVAVVRANGAVEVTMAAPGGERRAVVEVKFDDRTYTGRGGKQCPRARKRVLTPSPVQLRSRV